MSSTSTFFAVLAAGWLAVAQAAVAATNTWQAALARITIPAIELRNASLSDAVGQINRAAAEAATNGAAPAVTVDLTPTKVVVTDFAARSVPDRYRDELVARWKQKHAYLLDVQEPGLVTLTLQNVRADSAIRIVSQHSAQYTSLQDREGKPVLGYDRECVLECRTYPWPARRAGAVNFKQGLDGAEDLEVAFDSGRGPPRPYTMMLVPAINLLLVVAEPEEQRRIARYLEIASGAGEGANGRTNGVSATHRLPGAKTDTSPAFSGTTDE